MSQKERLFSNRYLVKLCVPLIIEQTLNVLVGMVDVLMVAAVGEAAVSGVSLVDSINLLLIQVLGAMATGGAVVCSQFLGKKEEQKASRSAGQLILVSLIGTILITLGCVVGNRQLLRLIFGSVETEVMDNAIIYFRLTALSFPFLGLYNAGAALFRSMGNSKVSMFDSMLMNAINVVGNAICIFGLHMGVAGVALPTLLARMIASVLILSQLRNPGNKVHLSSVEEFRPDVGIIRKIMAVGVPNGLENGMFQFGKVLLSSLISTLGTASIAGYAVAYNLAMFLYLPGNSMGLGLVTVTGQCVGAKKYDQALFYQRLIFVVNYLMVLIIGIVLGVGRHGFVGLYGLSSEAAVIGARMLLIHCFGMILWPPAFLTPNVLRASFDAKYTMAIAVISMWAFRVGFAYIFVKVLHLGVYGVWYAMFLDWAFRGAAYLFRFRGYTERLERISQG